MYLGDFPTSHTSVVMVFDTFAAATGAPTATTNFAAGDILIFKDGSTTQRSSSAGIVVSTSFDTNTGLQLITIDLSDNTDAGFYAAGHEYSVAVADITADGQTLRFWLGAFSIERANGVLALIKGNAIKVDVNTIKTNPVVNGGTITFPTTATLASTTNITAATGVDITKILGTTIPTPTVAGIPNVNVKTWNDLTTVALPLIPTTAGRTLDVTATGEAGVDWANIGAPTTTVNLSGTTIATTQKVDIDTIKTNPVVNGGTITFPTTATLASTTNVTAGTITTVTNLTNAPTSGDLTATMKTSVTTACTASTPTAAAVTGAVGSVTGNVGGSVASVTAAVAITSNIKKNQALAKFQFLLTDSTTHNPVTGKTVTVTRSIDNAAFGAGTLSAVTEIANGMYSIDFGAGDLNGNVIILQATASGSDTTFERIITQP